MKILKRCCFSPGITLVFLLNIFVFGCKNETVHPLPDAGDTPPDQVNTVRVENIAGGAYIFYTPPKSYDFAYVLAKWETKKGQESTQSSRYSDSLTVFGFPDTSAVKVELYSVSYGGAKSAPLSVMVHPKVPAYLQVFNHLNIQAVFGGIEVKYSHNINRGNVNVPNIEINLLRDSAGTITLLKREHIADSAGSFFIRGLEAKEYKIGYYVRDESQNKTDTVFGQYTPLYETRLIPKKYKWAGLALDWEKTGRAVIHRGAPSHLFEMNIGTCDCQILILTDLIWPFNMTIDLGQLAKVDRIVLHGEPQWGQYSRGYPKKYSIWGSADPNLNSDTIDDSWFKYIDYTSVPPSGGKVGTHEEIFNTDFNKGESIQLPDAQNQPYVRYITFHWISNYEGIDLWTMAAIEVYGQPKDPEANK